MSENQLKRLAELESYLRSLRMMHSNNDELKKVCTDGLAWCFLIEKDE